MSSYDAATRRCLSITPRFAARRARVLAKDVDDAARYVDSNACGYRTGWFFVAALIFAITSLNLFPKLFALDGGWFKAGGGNGTLSPLYVIVLFAGVMYGALQLMLLELSSPACDIKREGARYRYLGLWGGYDSNSPADPAQVLIPTWILSGGVAVLVFVFAIPSRANIGRRTDFFKFAALRVLPFLAFVLVLLSPLLLPAIVYTSAFAYEQPVASGRSRNDHYRLWLFARPPVQVWDPAHSWFAGAHPNATRAAPQPFYSGMNPAWNTGHAVLVCALGLAVLVPATVLAALPPGMCRRWAPCCAKAAGDRSALAQLARLAWPKTEWDGCCISGL